MGEIENEEAGVKGWGHIARPGDWQADGSKEGLGSFHSL